MLCATPLFAEDFEVDGMYYNITSDTDKTVAVTYRGFDYYNYSDKYSGAVTIPESVTYNGNTYSVTSIGDHAFYECSRLTSVVIPNSVTSIGEAAFIACYYLTSVEIGNSVTSIGDDAFRDCDGLTSVVIPNSVTSIGESAFVAGFNLTSITVAEDNQTYDSRNNCNAIIETQTNTLIAGCCKTTIPNTVTSIGDHAFHVCEGLTSVEIPNSVTSIGEYAFFGCTSLTSVVIPNSVTSIGASAFDECFRLTSVEIGNSVTSIGDRAFSWCNRLTSVEIGNSVTSIGDEAFYGCYDLTSVVIPNSVTSIGDNAFEYCDHLTTATVGCSWITNPLYEFDENVTVNATLHSYENGVCTVCGKEDTTGIDGITNNAHLRSATFDLHGRRMNKAGKGIYIVNGKKVLVK